VSVVQLVELSAFRVMKFSSVVYVESPVVESLVQLVLVQTVPDLAVL